MRRDNDGGLMAMVPRLAGNLFLAVQNGLEIARFGGIGEREVSPYRIVAEGKHHGLRRYYADAATPESPAALLVPPLMLTADVWDVTPAASAVAALHRAGIDPWVVDFGSPEKVKGGLTRTLTDHVLAVCEGVAQVREATGRDVHLIGYSQGGMFAYQAAAYLRSEGLASLVTFGSPVDAHVALPPILPTEVLIDALEFLNRLQAEWLPAGIPSWVSRTAFQLLDPVKTIQQRLDFARRLYDREALQQREGMRRFMDGEGWTAFPGPALRDLVDQLIAQNRLLQGGLVIGERPVTLADITCPILAFLGDSDFIAPGPAVRAISGAAPRAESYAVEVAAGHFGLVAGTRAVESTWPVVNEWIRWREGAGPIPARAQPLDPLFERPPSPEDGIAARIERLWNLGRDVVGEAAQAVGDRVGIVGRVVNAIVPQIPRLTRLAAIRSDTPISLGRALAERAREAPQDTFFLFDGRAYNYRDANERVDNIVRGLLQCGVRHGQHVGLLMETRPSAVAATAALSRLGAVAVMLRPDVALGKQLEVAPVDHLLADPDNAEAARDASGREVLVLGGGGKPRKLPAGLLDMEAIDPDLITPPDWYRPDPGTAGELALVLITGDGEHIGANRVSNRRWATSAYGTASACALTPHDTVYCCSPTHHATGILVCTGGALVSGARLAMTRHFEPQAFWDDVRRYGVNVVFYTGTLCRELVDAPETPAEVHNPLRMFAGSGMPKNVWKRVVERFTPARVVEFFASTEGNAVLVNLTGEKIGSVGRPLPGGAELAVAAWDLQDGRIAEQRSGFARRAADEEVGLLLARVDPARGEVQRRPLRGVFEPGDAWLDTGDLVRRDVDGDYWLVDHLADVIHTKHGAVASSEIEDLLAAELDFIDLIAVYGVRVEGLGGEVPVAAVTLRPGREMDRSALRRVVEERLARAQRPAIVRVMERLPMTAGQRIRKRGLRAEGLGSNAANGEQLWLAEDGEGYEPFVSEDGSRIVASLAGRY